MPARAALLVALLAALLLGAAAWGQEPAPKRVYGHVVPWFPPDHSRPDRAVGLAGGLAGQVRAAAAAGLDGFTVDVVLRPPTRALGAVRGYLTAAQAVPGFTVGPCLDTGASTDPVEWIDFLDAWATAAADDPHAMRRGDRLVIFTYAADRIPPEGWTRIRNALAARGHPLLLVGEVEGTTRRAGEQLPERLAAYAAVFDSLYTFAPHVEAQPALAAAMAAAGSGGPRIFSPSPGYWRHNTGSLSRLFGGTATYRESWRQARELNADWAAITTWNDYAEHTHIEPSRNNSDLLARLTAVEAARFRGEDPTAAAGEETFWLTAPAELPDGPGPGPLEPNPRRERTVAVTRIGPPAGERVVQVALLQPDGGDVERREITLDAGEPVSERAFDIELHQTHDVPFLRVTASAGGARATLPIPLWPRDVSRAFYLAPRRARLTAAAPVAPTLAVIDGRLAVEPIEPPAPDRVDLLHNLFQRPDPTSTTARVAQGAAQMPEGAPGWGFWGAARVAPDATVAWADPVWVAPDGDPRTLALYRFEDGAADATIYGRNGRVHGNGDFAELADGTRALRSGDVWVEPPGGFLPHAGPLTIELWVRPEAEGGMLWGDVAAPLLLSLEGLRPRAARKVEGGPWVGVTAPEPLPLGQWSHVAGVYDGARLQLCVDGRPVGEIEAGPAGGSNRMGIGRNPFDGSSPVRGLIDDVRVTGGWLRPEAFGPVNPLKARPADPR